MDWITILALVGVAFGGAILFGAGCSLGRGYAQRELAQERHRRLVLEIRIERLEKDKVELRQRLKDSRADYYMLSESVIERPKLAKVLPLLRDGEAVPEAG